MDEREELGTSGTNGSPSGTRGRDSLLGRESRSGSTSELSDKNSRKETTFIKRVRHTVRGNAELQFALGPACG